MYGDVFIIPEPVICSCHFQTQLYEDVPNDDAAPARRIMSLTDPSKKMSKSDPNPSSRILITDDDETIRQKFRTALTDSCEGISYDPEKRPGVSNLLDILRHTRDDSFSSHELAADFKDSSLRSLKQTVADEVVKSLREVRERFLEHRSNLETLHFEASVNQGKASLAAGRTWGDVRRVTGMGPIGY
jgi:tryptophanyl-tRNA synthetase